MNIKTEKGTLSLSDAVKARLQDTSYESGELEQAREVADQTTRAFGDLIDLLASKKVLTHEEALDFTNYSLAGWNQATLEP